MSVSSYGLRCDTFFASNASSDSDDYDVSLIRDWYTRGGAALSTFSALPWL